MEQAQKQRSSYWDNIKGFLIILVVFAHLLYDFQSDALISGVVSYIYMFHMPAFVFVSGFFGKSKNSRSIFSLSKLIFIYIVFNSLMGFIYGFQSLLQPVYSFWYIPAIVVWRLTAEKLSKIKYIVPVLIFVSLMTGFFNSIDNTFGISRIICFYPFYMSGYLLSEKTAEGIIKQKASKRILKAAGLLVLTAVLTTALWILLSPDTYDLLMFSYGDKLGIVKRIVLFTAAYSAIIFILMAGTDEKIPLLTMFGRNSLWIYVMHRIITLIITDYYSSFVGIEFIGISIVVSIAICLIFGNDIISRILNRFAESGADLFKKGQKTITSGRIAALFVCLLFAASAVVSYYTDSCVILTDGIKPLSERGAFSPASESQNNDNTEDTGGDNTEVISDDLKYRIITDEQSKAIKNAFRITFAGDLILLEDQVKRGYTESGYNFDPVFEYSQEYISSADFAVGVFEGPMAGEQAGYSSSNYDDGKELYLNFPDEYAQAVKNAGFDLVTTANNHLLDRDEAGAMRTLDVLDIIGLDHTGSYRNSKEKEAEHIRIIEKDGLRMAFLSYTYGSNYYDTDLLAEGELSYISSFIADTEGELFEKLKASVINDLKKAKSLSPDLIVVLPHWGTQFLNEPDEMEKVWSDIFLENGADIILGDHPHVVQPASIVEKDGKKRFVAYCPGNFANIYRENQGDTSMLVDVYIDRDTKGIIAGGIVPLYTQSSADGNFRALPTYEIKNNPKLRESLSVDDCQKADESNKLVTKIALKNELDMSTVTESYYFDEKGYMRSRAPAAEMTEEMKSGVFMQAVNNMTSVCFVGDSLTEGTKNGGVPWYEPVLPHISGKKIYNYSKGGATVSYFLDRISEIPKADIYVIAVGTNDVRYRDQRVCAMDENEYVQSIEKLTHSLRETSPWARFVYIAPWYSVDGDNISALSFGDKTMLNEKYCSSLEKYCKEHSLEYINANPEIIDNLRKKPDSFYLLDHIHPDSVQGVKMYSEAVLDYQKK